MCDILALVYGPEMTQKYALLIEKALANFEILLKVWDIEYKYVTPYEVDFINPLRNDRNFGACRFNVQKGRGADFAGINFSKADIDSFGEGFNEDDFAGVSKDGSIQTSYGFDIIGLCQRLHKLPSYREAASFLQKQINSLANLEGYTKVTKEAIEKRAAEERLRREKNIKKAYTIWGLGKPITGTLGEKYLESRNIFLSEPEPNMGFHTKIYNSELKMYIPALLFKVQQFIDDEGHVAVHRVYLGMDGQKAGVDEVKMAVGSIKGAGIWLGKKSDTLSIGEGPETALFIRSLGFDFVVSTVFSTNYHNLTIPGYVKNVILFPDEGKAGESALQKAVHAYKNIQRKNVSVVHTRDLARGLDL